MLLKEMNTLDLDGKIREVEAEVRKDVSIQRHEQISIVR